MKIFFRADANKNIGVGHVMRCMSLADALTDNGHECVFVVSDDSFSANIKDRGFRCLILGSDFRDMESETDRLEELMRTENPELLVIDSYYVTDKYFKTVKKTIKTAYFDDVLEFAYDVDILIDYNIYADAEDYGKLYEGMKLPRFILGPKYAPLRKEFSKGKIKPPRDKAESVMISVGGSDPLHVADAFIKMIDASPEMKENLLFRFVLSNMEPDIEKIRAIAEKEPWLELNVNVKDMKGLMDKSDIAVSAAGSTQYELCACGVPTINFAFADNQVPGGEKFGKEGIFLYAGDLRTEKNFYDKVGKLLTDLYKDKKLRTKMSEKAYALTDGKGAERLAKELLNE